MENDPQEQLNPKALKVWFYSGLLWGALLLSIPVVYFTIITRLWNLSSEYGWIFLAGILIYTVWRAIVVPQIKIRVWRYDIRTEEIDIQHGIFVKKRTLIPMTRVQHVDTEHGPIMRFFRLATLRISTAATNHRIPALSQDKAAKLQGEISTLARTSDEDV